VVKKLILARATASLAVFVRELNGDVLVLTDSGKPVAALVPIRDMDMESLAVGTSPKFLDIIERARRRHEEEGGISQEEMRRRLKVGGKSKSKAAIPHAKNGRKPSKRNAP
jgi:antitoxin (DNA-binding transcriptional repressor) of toxin-antitoxin stability system